jgi:hypothetical protein
MAGKSSSADFGRADSDSFATASDHPAENEEHRALGPSISELERLEPRDSKLAQTSGLRFFDASQAGGLRYHSGVAPAAVAPARARRFAMDF